MWSLLQLLLGLEVRMGPPEHCVWPTGLPATLVPKPCSVIGPWVVMHSVIMHSLIRHGVIRQCDHAQCDQIWCDQTV